MQQVIENLFEQMIHMGGLIFVVLIFASLFLCWTFRSTISKLIEHFYGFSHTMEHQQNTKPSQHISEAKKTIQTI